MRAQAKLLLLRLGLAAFFSFNMKAPAEEPAGRLEVFVTGVCPDTEIKPDEAALADAYRKALLKAAPVYIETRTEASMNQLIADYQMEEVRGFIEKVRPVGKPRIKSGIYSQEYQMVVNRGDFDLELMKKKFDVKILYHKLQRPRICLALEDYGFDPNGPSDKPGPTRFSNGEVIKYFRSKGEFEFRDLNFLRKDKRDDEDFVREANNGSFDILIYGQTRYLPTTIPGRDGTPGSSGRPPFIRWDVAISWNVIEVAYNKPLFVVQKFGTSADSRFQSTYITQVQAGFPAKALPVLDAVEDLFHNLLVTWNKSAMQQKNKFLFLFSGEKDAHEIALRLKTVNGVNPQSVSQEGSDSGEITFSAAISKTGSEVQSSLNKAFTGEFRVVKSANRQFVLGDNKAVPPITVKVSGIDFGRHKTITAALKALTEIQEVNGELKNREGIYTVKTRVDTETLAEKLGKLQFLDPPGRLSVGSVGAQEILSDWAN